MEGVAAVVTCGIEGQFVSEEPLPDDAFERFREREAFVLLWPYIRAAVGEITRMLGVLVPPLPTVDVRSILGDSALGGEEEHGNDPATG
jgi:hypothetical protein